MLEFFFAKHYLWPKKRQLSVSLIGLMSIAVISLVIWLLVLFISVTEGIEKTWLTKLTSLNAGIRITPTEAYFNSYYYQIDNISSKSNYQTKTIGEKLVSSVTDPYNPEIDEEIPFYWPSPIKASDGTTLDFAKGVFAAIEKVGKDYPNLKAQDYEISGALARFQLIRPERIGTRIGDGQSFLTQAAYIASFSDKNEALIKLLQEPSLDDINHLLYLSHLSSRQSPLQDRPEISYDREVDATHSEQNILNHLKIEEVSLKARLFELPLEALPDKTVFTAFAECYNGQVAYILLASDKESSVHDNLVAGTFEKEGKRAIFKSKGKTFPADDLPIFFAENQLFSVEKNEHMILSLKGTLQTHQISFQTPFTNLDLVKCKPITEFASKPACPPPWVYFVAGQACFDDSGIILPKNFRDYHVRIGDRGYFSYGTASQASVQEQRLPMKVVGFYDPGVMAVGARFFLAKKNLVHHICLATESVALDPMLTNGIGIFYDKIKKIPLITESIKTELKEQGLDSYFEVIPFYEYDFAKDLMGQFQSDRYLFMLIGFIILLVGCSNIITLLLLLVNDKKHEIGIIMSLGAKKWSIATIFGICGTFMGLISCIIGILLAYFTLNHIDTIVHLLNIIEGQEAFNTAFYGESLPSTISASSIIFVLIVAPILSLIAGLIPAVKACRLNPSAILRSE